MNVRYLSGFRVLLSSFVLALPFSAQGQSAMQRVRLKNEVVVATDATYPPFEYVENGKVIGFDVDLGAEIGKEIGIPFRFQSLEWAGVLGSLESGKADLVMSGVTITQERKQKGYLFSRPYFLSGQTIARRKGDTRIAHLSDLKDKVASVQQETTGQIALEKAGVPKDHILKFDQLQDGLTDVQNRKSDAAVADLPALTRILKRSFPDLELVGGVEVSENVGIVAWKGETELIARVNKALERIMADGRYAAIHAKWIEERLPLSTLAGLEKVKGDGSPVSEIGSDNQVAPPALGAVPSPLSSRLTVSEILKPLVRGASLTLQLTFYTLLFGVPVGLIVALMRMSVIKPISLIASVYVEIIRGTPLLMQIYVIYFVLPSIHINLNAFISGVLALSLNAAAYISEIFRAGIESIDSGQMEAAKALGMDYRTAMRYVILPQTVRRILPPMTNEAVSLLKDTSLVSVVALAEIMRVGKELATNSGEPTRIYLTIAVVYLVLTLPLTMLTRFLEQKWKPVSRG